MAKKKEKLIKNQRRIPKQQRAIQKCEAVLSACAQLLQEQGYAKTSVLELSLESGVAVPTIYQYFDNKEAIFLSWFESLASRVFDKLPELATDVPSNELIQNYIRITLRMVNEQKRSAYHLLEEVPNALSAQMVLSLEEQTLRFVEGLLGKELDDRLLNRERLLVLIRLLLGNSLMMILNPDRELDIEQESYEIAAIVQRFFSDS